MKSNPLLLPGRHALNASLLLANVAAGGYLFYDPSLIGGLGALGTTAALSATMGVTLTSAIGGKCTRVSKYQCVLCFTSGLSIICRLAKRQ